MGKSWLAGAGSSQLDDLLSLRPELAELRVKLLDRLWGQRLVDPVVLELCRLRIASLVGDDESLLARTPEAADAGLTEGQIAALASWSSDDRFTPKQRAALSAAEMFVIDVRSIDNAELDAHFDGDERYAMFIGFALFDGFGRMRRVLSDTSEEI